MAVKRGIILMNLGSPDSTSVPDVRRYLNEFLMDKKVIDMPYLSRLLLVKGIIVPFRAKKSAEAYKTIWTKEGSPLVVLTEQLQEQLQALIEEPVEIAMRYGNPSPAVAFDNLMKRETNLEEVIAVPLYPHYAMASYETAVDYAKAIHEKNKYPFKLEFIKPFFDEQHYIAAMVDNMRPYLNEPYDHILFSYHGIPQRHLVKTDPTGSHCTKVENCCAVASGAHSKCYRHQCFTSTKLIADALNIPADKYSISFQSRLGKGWLEPFTDVRLEEMPREGIKKLLVLCPAFISDCLETLEEIEERGKESFMEAGGETYKMIPCLNIHPAWVGTLEGWVKEIGNGSKEMLLNQ
ncbi:MAG: ferrochelatase [Chitinophagaceae bacterium]|nr:MAG: ferrochelatase [Chitinophagaceae bacterium]